ncbi:MAG TPA: biopolymer transporter ExbD [candidate division Zixibacteria bacterium]|nr:biopolymer transporter ExbD [candidate division Zixibacteria bacterium]
MALRIKKKQHLTKEAEIPTASLGDIVFLLLIFFLVTTSMNPDKGLGLTLPPPGEAVKLSKERILSVYVNAEGKILVGEEIIPLDQLDNVVERRLRQNPQLVVSLVTDVKASYEDMIHALDKIKLAFERLKKEDPKFKERISLATPVF